MKIREIAERLAKSGAHDPLYDVPFTTGHTGVVHGGTALNIVPDRCVFEFEFRSIAADDLDTLVDEVKAYARDVLEPDMKAVAPEAGFVFENKSGFPGLELEPQADMARLAKHFAGNERHGKVAFGTEAGLFGQPASRRW